jgi:cytochrome P450
MFAGFEDRKRAASKLAPGPRTYNMFGELAHIRRDRLGFVLRMARNYGDIVRFRMGPRVLHLVSEPDGVRHVLQANYKNYKKGVGIAQAKQWLGEGLVTSEGELWARHRRIIQPAINRDRLAVLSPFIVSAALEMLERWRFAAGSRYTIDVASEMMALTLKIIAQVLFKTDLSNVQELGEAFAASLQDAMDRMTAVVMLPDWLPVPGKLRFRRALRTLEATVYDIIRSGRNCDDGDGDGGFLLSLLNSRFSDKEIRDQILTMLLAGHETTASSLAWTFYLLSEHPWAWKRLRAELDDVLGGRPPTHDDLPRLVWTRMVWEEALRLYPPVWLIPRRAIAADEIGGYFIPANSDVLISPFVIHRDTRYWHDPSVFDPERFSPNRPERRPDFTYLPFGSGPRACVGQPFAMTEALLVLAMVNQRYCLSRRPNCRVVPEPLLTLRLRNGLPMMLVAS